MGAKNPKHESLEWWIHRSINMVDQVVDISKRESASPAVRGELEDAVISLHNARRLVTEPWPLTN